MTLRFGVFVRVNMGVGNVLFYLQVNGKTLLKRTSVGIGTLLIFVLKIHGCIFFVIGRATFIQSADSRVRGVSLGSKCVGIGYPW